jgi:hypothetical protein
VDSASIFYVYIHGRRHHEGQDRYRLLPTL